MYFTRHGLWKGVFCSLEWDCKQYIRSLKQDHAKPSKLPFYYIRSGKAIFSDVNDYHEAEPSRADLNYIVTIYLGTP